MWTFGDLNVGDMFNTKAGRYVKVCDTGAITVMSAVFELGSIHNFRESDDFIVILWSSNPDIRDWMYDAEEGHL